MYGVIICKYEDKYNIMKVYMHFSAQYIYTYIARKSVIIYIIYKQWYTWYNIPTKLL